MSSTPEHAPRGPERGSAELSTLAGERLKQQIENGVESSVETSPERPDAKHERREIDKVFAAESGSSEHRTRGNADGDAPVSPAHVRPKVASKKDREASFKKEISHVQDQLPASSRAFSKVIHNKAVEAVSDKAAASVARPNIILAGGISAFVIVAIVYVIARVNGYRLSGTETMFAFVFGWVIGAVFDFMRVMVTGKRA